MCFNGTFLQRCGCTVLSTIFSNFTVRNNLIMSNTNRLLTVGNFLTRLCFRRELRGHTKSRVSKVKSLEENNVDDFSYEIPKLDLTVQKSNKSKSQFTNDSFHTEEKKPKNMYDRNSKVKFLDENNVDDFSKLDLTVRKSNRSKSQFTNNSFPTEEKKPKNKLSFVDVTEENMYDRLYEAVTPLHNVPYFKQLKIKQTKCVNVMQHLAKELKTKNIFITRDSKGLPCPLEQVRPSPENIAYRNKDEFAIRPGIDGNPKTVGFFIGSPAENDKVICIHPKEVANIKPIHLQVVKHFQEYIRQSSLPACINFWDGGNWHRLHVRSNVHGELMVVAIMHPQNLSQEAINLEKDLLKKYFTEGPGKELNIKSLYFQACPQARCSNEQAPFQLLSGEPYIFEQIGNLRLRISPETFLQVNSSAAPILYDTIRDLSGITSSTTVLDVCCGAGSIGMHLAEKASRVIGIEISHQATEDAKYNIELNGIKNMAVLNGEAELIVPRIIDDFYSDDLVAVLNPSRAGFRYSLICALRECKHLRRIIYVACKPEGMAMNNFIQLCERAGKNARLGKPFIPLYAVPVDMFPHTHHCELVVMFERATV